MILRVVCAKSISVWCVSLPLCLSLCFFPFPSLSSLSILPCPALPTHTSARTRELSETKASRIRQICSPRTLLKEGAKERILRRNRTTRPRVAGGVHGNNRLGGSSVLDCVVFRRVAGAVCAKCMLGDKGESDLVGGLFGRNLTSAGCVYDDERNVETI